MKENLISWLKTNKWLVAGLAIAILNPLPSGIILGIVMLTEEKLVKAGRITLIVSVALVIILLLVAFLLPSFPQRR